MTRLSSAWIAARMRCSEGLMTNMASRQRLHRVGRYPALPAAGRPDPDTAAFVVSGHDRQDLPERSGQLSGVGRLDHGRLARLRVEVTRRHPAIAIPGGHEDKDRPAGIPPPDRDLLTDGEPQGRSLGNLVRPDRSGLAHADIFPPADGARRDLPPAQQRGTGTSSPWVRLPAYRRHVQAPLTR